MPAHLRVVPTFPDDSHDDPHDDAGARRPPAPHPHPGPARTLPDAAAVTAVTGEAGGRLVTGYPVPIAREPDADLLPYALLDAVALGDPEPLARLIWPAGQHLTPATRHRVGTVWALAQRHLGEPRHRGAVLAVGLRFLDHLVEVPALAEGRPAAVQAACTLLPMLAADRSEGPGSDVDPCAVLADVAARSGGSPVDALIGLAILAYWARS